MIKKSYYAGVLKRLNSEISKIKKEYVSMPSGRLHCYKNGESYKWFRVSDDGASRKYIKRDNRDLAVMLARKEYLKAKLMDLEAESMAYSALLSKWPESSRVEALIERSDGFRELLADVKRPIEDKALEWQKAPYNHNMNYPEKLNVPTGLGYYVRSKSERDIALMLTEHGIPFRYECELILNGMVLYPDFMVLNPKTHKLYIWEHFGLSGDKNYDKSVACKLDTYRENGYYPMINLITTYETKDNPLDLTLVEDLIKHFFE